MRQILIVQDAEHFDAQLLDFAATISKNGKTFFKGIFVSSQTVNSTSSIKSVGGQLYVEEITASPEESEEKKQLCHKNIEAFNSGCAVREIISKDCRHYWENALDNVIEESRYADLLILASDLSPTGELDSPTKFVRDIISRSECPVIIAPTVYDQLDDIVFGYDGSGSSVAALKQFYYLFPELSDKTIHILHIDEKNSAASEISPLLLDWLNGRYKNISLIQLHGNPRDVLFEYFMANNMNSSRSVLLSAAFGRGALSEFFKHSAIETVLKTIDIPVFISHH